MNIFEMFLKIWSITSRMLSIVHHMSLQNCHWVRKACTDMSNAFNIPQSCAQSGNATLDLLSRSGHMCCVFMLRSLVAISSIVLNFYVFTPAVLNTVLSPRCS